MDPILLGALGMGAFNLGKSLLVDKKKSYNDKMLNAEMIRQSPWIGLKQKEVTPYDTFGSAMTGIATGAQIGSGINQIEKDNLMNLKQMELMAAQKAALDKGYGLQSAMSAQPVSKNGWGLGGNFSFYE